MLLNLLLLSFILLGIAFAGLALNILIRKKGKFPAYRVGHNADMKKMGIHCVKHEEQKCHRENLKKPVEKDCAGCQQVSV